MTNLTPEQLVKELSKSFGNLLDASMHGLAHYANREDLFDEFPEVLNAAKEFLEKQEPVECEFETGDMFCEDNDMYASAFDGKLVESDTNIELDVTLLFRPNDGVYISNTVRFRPIGIGEPATEFYVFDGGECMEFEDYARAVAADELEDVCEYDEYGELIETDAFDDALDTLKDKIYDNLPRASASDFDDIAFNEVVLLDFSK